MGKSISKSFFKNRTWKKFSIRSNLKYLMGEKWIFDEEPQLITKEIAAWVTTKNKGIRKSAIRLEMIRTIAVEEEKIIASGSKHVAAVLLQRATAPKIGFFQHAYFPTGGMSSLIKADSPNQHLKRLQKFTQQFDIFIEVMRILHFWFLELNDPSKFKQPSRNNMADMAKSTGDWRGQKVRPNAKTRLKISPLLERGSLIYAASTIKVEGGKFLLQEMKDNSLTYARLQPVLAEWLGRANYITENMMGLVHLDESKRKIADFEIYPTNRRAIPTLLVVPFDIDPPYSDEKKAVIRHGYLITKGTTP